MAPHTPFRLLCCGRQREKKWNRREGYRPRASGQAERARSSDPALASGSTGHGRRGWIGKNPVPKPAASVAVSAAPDELPAEQARRNPAECNR